MQADINKMLEVVPNSRQLALQEMPFYCFIHYGINTMASKEWSNGKLDPKIFNPINQNTDQWCQAMLASGAKGVILTAKHHDGFCLWQTKTTEYSIKNSPYQNGKGDVVKELSQSCKKFGLKFGIYLSPWDRNSQYYGTPQYDEFYIEQLTELLTNYGDVFCMWFDGACASGLDGKPKQQYDFNRYFQHIHKLQPKCLVSNCGPDVRWVGNEAGKARESEWNVVPFELCDQSYIASLSQNSEQDSKRLKSLDQSKEDLGSREFLSKYDKYIWYPAEVDVSIRPGWFYHKIQDLSVRSVDNLMNIYDKAVGGNSLLLLNVPPNKQGLFSNIDVKRLQQLGQRINKAFQNKVKSDSFICKSEQEEYNKEIMLDAPCKVGRIVLREDTKFSQRVEKFCVEFFYNGNKVYSYKGSVIGFRKFVVCKGILADKIKLTISQCRSYPIIESIDVYEKID